MKSGRYYQTRVGKQPPDYEGAYWHVVKDPDGREGAIDWKSATFT